MENKYCGCGKISNVPLDEINNFVDGAEKRVIFSPDNGFSEFMAVRDFRVEPGIISDPHEHEWAHCIIGISGVGSFIVDNEVAPIAAGSWCYIPGDMPHYFKNDGNDMFEFICIVPPEGDVNPNDSDLFEC